MQMHIVDRQFSVDDNVLLKIRPVGAISKDKGKLRFRCVGSLKRVGETAYQHYHLVWNNA